MEGFVAADFTEMASGRWQGPAESGKPGVLNGILWVLRTERRGKISRIDIHRQPPATGGFRNGAGGGCRRKSCKRWPRI